MSLLILLAAAASDHRVEFTRYESREPTAAQTAAYKRGDKQALARLLPVVDRVVLRLEDGETERFASGTLNGYATLEVDDMGYLLRFDSGQYEHKSAMLLQQCRPMVFYVVRSRAAERSRIVAESVSIGEGC